MRGRGRAIALRGRGFGAGAADTVAPALQSATVAANGTTVTTVWDQAVTHDEGFLPWLGGDSGADLEYASGDGTTTLVYTTADAMPAGASLTAHFEAGSVDGLGGIGCADTFDFPVTNNSTQTRPAVVGRTVLANGTTLRLVFDAAVTGFGDGAPVDNNFTLTGLSGGATTLDYTTGTGTTTVDFAIGRTVTSAETGGLLAYTAVNVVVVKVSNGMRLANFSNAAVANNSTQLDGGFG